MSRRTSVARAVTAAALLVLPLTTATASDARPDLGGVRHAAGSNGKGNGDGNANGKGQDQGNATSNGNDDAAGGSVADKGKDKDQGDGPANVTGPAKGKGNGPAAGPPAPPAADSPALRPVVSLGTDATAPALGTAVGVAQAAGRVVVRTGSGAPLQDLADAAAIPVGAHVDAREGTVELATAVDADGATQVGRFTGGIFEVRQSPGAKGLTRLVLIGGTWRGCSTGAVARAAAKKRKPRRSLWGSDSGGRFQTSGRGSVATVRGTRWLTEDFCDGTRTTVAEGAVAVRDLRRHKTVVVTAGHSYFAAAPRP